MGRFGFIKDKATGTSKLIEMDEAPLEAVPVAQPASASLAGTEAARYQCMVDGCGKPFRTSGVAAIHFKNAHPDLAVDKHTWRKYVKGAAQT